MREKKPKFVNVYKDRTGKWRIYLRRPGRPRVALPGPYKSEAFWKAYHAAMDAVPPVVGATRTMPGSISAAIIGYYGSAEFKSLAPTTQVVYRGTLERFRAEHGDGPIGKIETKHVNAFIDALASTPAAANNFRKRLGGVMRWAVGAGLRDDNPVDRAKRVRETGPGFRTWTEGDIAAYRAAWPEDNMRRIAMELLLHTGLRRSDAVCLGWQHLDDGAFVITARKTGAELHIPVHPDLDRYLLRIPKSAATFIQTGKGNAKSEKSFSAYISTAAAKAGLPPRSSPHGLRKAACRRLAEAGCSAMEIMSITGHTDIREIERYCREAAKRSLSKAAMAKSSRMFDNSLTNANPVSHNDEANALDNNGETEEWRPRQD